MKRLNLSAYSLALAVLVACNLGCMLRTRSGAEISVGFGTHDERWHYDHDYDDEWRHDHPWHSGLVVVVHDERWHYENDHDDQWRHDHPWEEHDQRWQRDHSDQ